MNLNNKQFNSKKFDNECYKKEETQNKNISDYVLTKNHNVDKNCYQHNPEIRNQMQSELKNTDDETKLFGIDISEVSINKAIENAKNLNLQIDYSVDNCEKTKFRAETFDLVFGSGILHHLNLKKSVEEVNRVLKNNGEMVFL